MADDSDSDGTAKVLGIVASVIGILAFLGITDFDDLENVFADPKAGDCVRSDGDTVVSCGDDDAVYTVLDRFDYDENAFYKVYGYAPSEDSEDLNEWWTCAYRLGWADDNDDDKRKMGIEIDGEEMVLCLQML